jgi:hypothetical protein
MDIKERVKKLISGLKISEKEKTELLEKAEAGVSQTLFSEIEVILDQAEKKYVEEQEAEIASFQKEFEAVRAQIEALEQDQKTEVKEERKKADESALDEIRKSINLEN